MHSLTKFVVAVVFASAVVALSSGPASAGSGGPDRGNGGVTPTGDGLLGRVRQQVNEVNQYVGRTVPCEWDPDGGDGPQPNYPGHWEIRLLREVGADDPSVWAEGLQWVQECVPNDRSLYVYDTVEEDGWSPNWQGVWITDAITPGNLARLAMDEFFLGLPAPQPRFNPASPAMVHLPTWMWMEGVPAGQVASPVISVPGISVQAFAQVVHVEWNMGNGDTKSCPGVATDAATASATCTYVYERSSAAQAGAVYHGTAGVTWEGRYTVNGAFAAEVFTIPRETAFTLGVEESQALNTDG
jgi:hypothetical protein